MSSLFLGCSPTPRAAAAADTSRAPEPAAAACQLPMNLRWTSSPPLIRPPADGPGALISVKDPTVVRFGDRWHVYATSFSATKGYNMVYTSFENWDEAAQAPLQPMATTPGFDTYVAAPQLFFFTPQKKWYLIFQSGPPMFSTADQPDDPSAWTRPRPLFAVTPDIIEKNGGWLDFWVICDAEHCHLFFSDDRGRWYRSKTRVADFPLGFGPPEIVLEDAEAGRVYEASNVYKLKGSGGYLALIEAFDASSQGRRYFRSWTADSLDGPWLPWHEGGAAPFAGARNVSFMGDAWTADISHGEMLRAGYDEKLELDPCRLRYLFQGFAPSVDPTNYNDIPWQLGLLTQQ